jgi:hypothetical protein
MVRPPSPPPRPRCNAAGEPLRRRPSRPQPRRDSLGTSAPDRRDRGIVRLSDPERSRPRAHGGGRAADIAPVSAFRSVWARQHARRNPASVVVALAGEAVWVVAQGRLPTVARADWSGRRWRRRRRRRAGASGPGGPGMGGPPADSAITARPWGCPPTPRPPPEGVMSSGGRGQPRLPWGIPAREDAPPSKGGAR